MRDNIRLRKSQLVLFSAMLIHLILGIICIQHQEITFDEPGYINYAKRWIKGQPERVVDIDDSKTPLAVIAWIPRLGIQALHPSYKATDLGIADLKNGRYMMVIVLWLIIAYTILWSNSLYGRCCWWLQVALLLLDPLILAYSFLINSDLLSGFILLACMYHFYRYTHTQRKRHFIFTTIYLGLGLSTKQGFILLPVILLSVYCIRKLVLREKVIVKRLLFRSLVCLGGGLFIFNSIFFFNGTFKTLGDYHFISHSLQHLQLIFEPLKSFPTLLPEPYWQSIDMLQYHAEIGPGYKENPFPGVYIFGNYSKDGFWFYYLLTTLIKLPIGLMMLIGAAIFICFKRFNKTAFADKYIFILFPVMFYFVIMSLFNPFQTGIRHALIFIPLGFIGIGYLGKISNKRRVIAISILLLWNVVSAAFYYPDIIPYTNEFVRNNKNVHLYLFDTSIDYGQSDTAYKPFIRSTSFRYAPSQPDTGKFIIPARFVMDKWDPLTNQFNWLQKYQPINTYKSIYLLYDIKQL